MSEISPDALVRALKWRYAVQQFDSTRRIAPECWTALEEALVLTPSSSGLQPWKFVVVTEPAVKERLRTAAWNQAQVGECSHFVVLAVRRNLGVEHVERHVARMSEVRQVPVDSLHKYRSMVTGNLDRAREKDQLDVWQTHQIYIALGNFMTSAALLGVDTCPMEGIQTKVYDEILGLAPDWSTVVACAAGYRAADDKYAAMPKVRFAKADVIVRR